MKPMGFIANKFESEEILESLVLGGDSDIIDSLEKSHEKINDKKPTKKLKASEEKHPAWEDEDDVRGSIIIANDRKFTRLVKEGETKVTKSEFSNRLKAQFNKVASTPNWAKLPSERDHNSSDEDSDVEDVLHRTGTYLTTPAYLPKGVIQVKQCTDVNKDAPLQSKVKALEFHPSAQVALTGGTSNTLSLFQIDGKTNPKIQSLFLEGFPIYCAHFTRDGEQVVIGSKHKSFKYFDMISGQVVNIPVKGLEDPSMSYFEVSPDRRFLAFMGKYGRIHFLSAKSKEYLFTLTMNGTVSCIAFSSDGSRLYSFGSEGQVYIWDIGSRECIHRFVDEGCTQGTTLAVSPNDQYLACGSNTGVVNLYETSSCQATFDPQPLRAVMNLTSSCSVTKFNATSEILAIASREDERAVKLVHVPSQSVFSNFPDSMDKSLRIPISLDFSVNSGYMAVGTNKGKALLYRLKHYGNY